MKWLWGLFTKFNDGFAKLGSGWGTVPIFSLFMLANLGVSTRENPNTSFMEAMTDMVKRFYNGLFNGDLWAGVKRAFGFAKDGLALGAEKLQDANLGSSSPEGAAPPPPEAKPETKAKEPTLPKEEAPKPEDPHDEDEALVIERKPATEISASAAYRRASQESALKNQRVNTTAGSAAAAFGGAADPQEDAAIHLPADPASQHGQILEEYTPTAA